MGSIHIDTLLVNEKASDTVVLFGDYDFTAETESGLILKAGVSVRGTNPRISIKINQQGKLMIE